MDQATLVQKKTHCPPPGGRARTGLSAAAVGLPRHHRPVDGSDAWSWPLLGALGSWVVARLPPSAPELRPNPGRQAACKDRVARREAGSAATHVAAQRAAAKPPSVKAPNRPRPRPATSIRPHSLGPAHRFASRWAPGRSTGEDEPGLGATNPTSPGQVRPVPRPGAPASLMNDAAEPIGAAGAAIGEMRPVCWRGGASAAAAAAAPPSFHPCTPLPLARPIISSSRTHTLPSAGRGACPLAGKCADPPTPLAGAPKLGALLPPCAAPPSPSCMHALKASCPTPCPDPQPAPPRRQSRHFSRRIHLTAC